MKLVLPQDMAPPQLDAADGKVVLGGTWTLAALSARLPGLREDLARLAGREHAWDLTAVTRLDAFGALLLWRAWGLAEPESLLLPAHLTGAFARIHEAAEVPREHVHHDWRAPFVKIGYGVELGLEHLRDLVILFGHATIESLRLLRHPREFPFLEVSASLYKTGVQALPIAALLGFLIGVVFSYLIALQLQNFGADAFIVNILGLGIIRELGPMLVSVLVAGRSGSAITAQIGVMRVTEEIDALAAMGVSRYQRIILPKVIALGLAMPMLVLWSSAWALGGGMLAAELQLHLDYRYFIDTLPKVVMTANLWIGLVKGIVFGVTIGVVACHFGLRIKPNTESLSINTTASVVTAISAVIAFDALIAVLTRTIGLVAR